MLLSRQHLDTMLTHAATSVDEVCGMLIGRCLPSPAVESVVPAHNVHPLPQRHFLLDAATLLQADATARSREQAIIGFYHSHPNGVALPSAEDSRMVWPMLLTLIVAVEQGQPRYVCAWRYTDSYLQPEPIRLL